MHRRTLGDFELTILSDGTYYLDGGTMFGVVPKVMWEKKMPADHLNRLRLGLNSLLIRTGEHNVLVETGVGNKLSDKRRQIYGNQEKLLESFAQAGVSPDEIDVVINTHLHFDHCGWNTMRQGSKVLPTFPRARYYVQQGELAHAHRQHERDRISYVSDNYDPLQRSGQLQVISGDHEILPGISVRLFRGHTEHMQAVMIHSRGQTACYISDLIPTTAHLKLTWVMAYDLFPLETIESRKRFYAEAIPQEWLVVFTHDHATPWARIQRREDGELIARPAEALAPA